MNQDLIKQNETLIENILIALGWNKISMVSALKGMEKVTSEGTREQQQRKLLELDKFLTEHDGEITEEQFLKIVNSK